MPPRAGWASFPRPESHGPRVAFHAGGMGHRDTNVHKDMMIRLAFGDPVQRIQELHLAKRKDEAVAAVADFGITGLPIVARQPEAMELVAQLAR